MSIVFLLMIGLLGAVWLVGEFYHIQQGHDSWDWCRDLYDRLRLDRIRW